MIDIRALRTRLGVTQERFARICGVTFATVNRWENGRHHALGDMAEVLVALDIMARTKRGVALALQLDAKPRGLALRDLFVGAYGKS